MPAAAQLLLSALSQQVPAQADPAPLTSGLPLADVAHLISGPPLADISLLLGESSFADAAPLTSEPPLADATPLTSEPPLAAVALSLPLTLISAAPSSAAPADKPQVLSSWTQTSASSHNAWNAARNNRGAWSAYGFDWSTDYCSSSPDN
uniref:hypothetical protein n=1 Tax=Streptomyces sp. DSM 41634 TaxID=3448656 RepID=UPI004040031A